MTSLRVDEEFWYFKGSYTKSTILTSSDIEHPLKNINFCGFCLDKRRNLKKTSETLKRRYFRNYASIKRSCAINTKTFSFTIINEDSTLQLVNTKNQHNSEMQRLFETLRRKALLLKRYDRTKCNAR